LGQALSVHARNGHPSLLRLLLLASRMLLPLLLPLLLLPGTELPKLRG